MSSERMFLPGRGMSAEDDYLQKMVSVEGDVYVCVRGVCECVYVCGRGMFVEDVCLWTGYVFMESMMKKGVCLRRRCAFCGGDVCRG